MTNATPASPFPTPVEACTGEEGLRLLDVLGRRATLEPLNLVATGLFLGAILHTFLAPSFMAASQRLRHRPLRERGKDNHSAAVEVLHLRGEVEVVFGLSHLERIPLFVGATVLTTFNDNAAITYLASLVPSFSASLQYSVVAGAVTGADSP